MVLLPSDGGAPTSSLLLAVPTAEAGLLGVEAGAHTRPEAALLALVLGPGLEGRRLCLGAALQMGQQVVQSCL